MSMPIKEKVLKNLTKILMLLWISNIKAFFNHKIEYDPQDSITKHNFKDAS